MAKSIYKNKSQSQKIISLQAEVPANVRAEDVAESIIASPVQAWGTIATRAAAASETPEVGNKVLRVTDGPVKAAKKSTRQHLKAAATTTASSAQVPDGSKTSKTSKPVNAVAAHMDISKKPAQKAPTKKTAEAKKPILSPVTASRNNVDTPQKISSKTTDYNNQTKKDSKGCDKSKKSGAVDGKPAKGKASVSPVLDPSSRLLSKSANGSAATTEAVAHQQQKKIDQVLSKVPTKASKMPHQSSSAHPAPKPKKPVKALPATSATPVAQPSAVSSPALSYNEKKQAQIDQAVAAAKASGFVAAEPSQLPTRHQDIVSLANDLKRRQDNEASSEKLLRGLMKNLFEKNIPLSLLNPSSTAKRTYQNGAPLSRQHMGLVGSAIGIAKKYGSVCKDAALAVRAVDDIRTGAVGAFFDDQVSSNTRLPKHSKAKPVKQASFITPSPFGWSNSFNFDFGKSCIVADANIPTPCVVEVKKKPMFSFSFGNQSKKLGANSKATAVTTTLPTSFPEKVASLRVIEDATVAETFTEQLAVVKKTPMKLVVPRKLINRCFSWPIGPALPQMEITLPHGYLETSTVMQTFKISLSILRGLSAADGADGEKENVSLAIPAQQQQPRLLTYLPEFNMRISTPSNIEEIFERHVEDENIVTVKSVSQPSVFDKLHADIMDAHTRAMSPEDFDEDDIVTIKPWRKNSVFTQLYEDVMDAHKLVASSSSKSSPLQSSHTMTEVTPPTHQLIEVSTTNLKALGLENERFGTFIAPASPGSASSSSSVIKTARITEVAERFALKSTTQIGIISLREFFDEMKKAPTSVCSKTEIMHAYFSLSERERAELKEQPNVQPVEVVLRLPRLQYKVLLGNIKLADFLKMIKFDERDQTSGAAVMRAFEECAKRDRYLDATDPFV